MLSIAKSLRIAVAVLLAIFHGGASVARSSHEAYAPSRVFLSEGVGPNFAEADCFSQYVTEHGAPVKPLHIHGCELCLFAVYGTLTPTAPQAVFLHLLPSKRPVSFDCDISVATGVRNKSSNVPRAPPFLS
jgi:hypothetical protein